MIRRMSHLLIWVMLLYAGGIVVRCSPGDGVAVGSGSTTTNGFTATVLDGQGKPVVHAVVRIRPSEYCATVDGLAKSAETVLDTVTGDDGSIDVGALVPGSYTVEVFDEMTGEGAVVRCEIEADSMRELGTLTLEQAGVIRGAVAAPLLSSSERFGVQVYGMEHSATVDSRSGTYILTGMPPAEYRVRLVSTDTSFKAVDFETVVVASGDTTTINPYASWNHTARLRINPDAAGLPATDTALNFPLLLRLDSSNFDFSTEQKKGEGFRVSKVDGSVVSFEQEWWDSANGTAAFWITIDTLYGSRTEQTLYLYWGNGSASKFSVPSAVFDTAFGFEGVWHLNESGGTEQEDATINNRIGIPHEMDGANDIPGIIGRAQEFDDGTQRIRFEPLQNGLAGKDNDFSVSLWVKAAGMPESVQGVFSRDDDTYGLFLDSTARWVVHGDAPGFENDSCSVTATVDRWVHLCCSRRDGLNVLYVNGRAVDSTVAGSSGVADAFGETVFQLGGFSGSTGGFFGVIDEFRIHRHALPEKWIRLCYETQREGQTAVTVGE